MPLKLVQRTVTFLVVYLTMGTVAGEVTVFDVRKNFPMKNGQKTYQDYYLNGGTEVGIKKGMVITVTRRRALYDAYQNRSPGNLRVPVGKLKVIQVQNGMSVARLHSNFSRANLPVLEYDFILVGDKMDIASAYFEKKRSKKSAKVEKKLKRNVAMLNQFSVLDSQPELQQEIKPVQKTPQPKIENQLK